MEANTYNDIFNSEAIDRIMVMPPGEFHQDITKWALKDEATADRLGYYKDASVFVTNLVNKTKIDIVSKANTSADIMFYKTIVDNVDGSGSTIDGTFYSKKTIAAARDYFEMIKTHPAFEGLTSNHALGMVANLLAESEFDGTILEGNSSKVWSMSKQVAPSKIALGVAQFTRSSGCVFLENTSLSFAKLNKSDKPNLKQLGSAIFNPVYQLDHLFRVMTANNYVKHEWNDAYIANALKDGGFFNKGIDANKACAIFFHKYERPLNQTEAAVLKRQAGMRALIKLM